jgi:uncharacterized protein
MRLNGLELPDEPIAAYCRANQIRELSVFGSVLRSDFRPDSDIDLLVDFYPEAEIGLLDFARMQRELTAIVGRRIDLVPKDGLKPYIRQSVLDSARLLYAA